VAFVGHVFGLWFVGRRLGTRVACQNIAALVLTAGVILAAAIRYGRWGAMVGWLVCHLGWGAYLASAVWRGETGLRR
jgi:hypothetical protein